jgi:tetratricopeptide (TPR) repeat protein
MRMLEQDPSDAFCLYGIAQEHASAGRFDEAVTWFQRTIQTDPAHAYARFHLAKALERKGDVASAIAALREGLSVARNAGDTKAANELAGYLDELT